MSTQDNEMTARTRTVGVYCSSSEAVGEPLRSAARQLGTWIGAQGAALVYGGNASGLMEELARAARAAGARVIGVVPRRLTDEGTVSGAVDVTIHCEDLNDRKQMLVSQSDALVALPGSVGTLDEMFTTMAQNTFGEHDKRVLLLNTGGFYDLLIRFLHSLGASGVVKKPWPLVFRSADTLEELERLIKEEWDAAK